eukprot:scaffold6678_cov336-Prasinococcus_capsulatus_cf.AAC.10
MLHSGVTLRVRREGDEHPEAGRPPAGGEPTGKRKATAARQAPRKLGRAEEGARGVGLAELQQLDDLSLLRQQDGGAGAQRQQMDAFARELREGLAHGGAAAVPEGVAEALQRALNERRREEEGRARVVAVQAGTHSCRPLPGAHDAAAVRRTTPHHTTPHHTTPPRAGRARQRAVAVAGLTCAWGAAHGCRWAGGRALRREAGGRRAAHGGDGGGARPLPAPVPAPHAGHLPPGEPRAKDARRRRRRRRRHAAASEHAHRAHRHRLAAPLLVDRAPPERGAAPVLHHGAAAGTPPRAGAADRRRLT